MRLRATLLGALTAAVLAVGTASAPAAFAAGSGQIDGTITDSSGAPVSTCVYVYDTDFTFAGQACSDDTGAYVVDGLVDGTAYRLDVQSDGVHSEQWFDGATTFDAATDVVAPGTADVVVQVAGTISGVLTNADGTPVGETTVYVYDTNYNYAGSAYTNPDGSWSASVPAGDYKVEFSNWPADMWYRQAFSFDAADVISVAAGETANADAQLISQGAITGTVTDAATGAPVSDICANVVDPATYEQTQNSVGYGCTDSAGVYRATVPGAGTYTVQFTDGVNGYVGVYAGGTRVIADAQTVTVGATGDVPLDQTMSIGAVITGKAIDSRTHKPIADVYASLYDGIIDPAAGHYPYVWGTGVTPSGADGMYEITGVPTGSYTMSLGTSFRSGYAQQWYAGATTQAKATKIPVTTLATVKLKDSKFVPGGTLTGTVTDAAGNPIAGAWVDPDGYYPGRAGPGNGENAVQTDENGHYSLVVPEGKYPALAYDYDGDYATTWSGGAVTRDTATLVTLKAGKSTTLNFVMKPGAHLTGRVVNADGSPPTSNVYAVGQIFTTSGDYIGDFDAFADNNWAINSNALPAGDFVLKADIVDQNVGDVTGTVWYDGKTTQSTATVVHLTTGETKDITFHLP